MGAGVCRCAQVFDLCVYVCADMYGGAHVCVNMCKCICVCVICVGVCVEMCRVCKHV